MPKNDSREEQVKEHHRSIKEGQQSVRASEGSLNGDEGEGRASKRGSMVPTGIDRREEER